MEKEAPSAAESVIELDGSIRRWSYVVVGLTFAWMFLLMILLKKLRWYQGSFFTYAYPLACLVASGLTLKSSRPGKVALSVLNFVSAAAWSAFVYWAAVQFGRHFWK